MTCLKEYFGCEELNTDLPKLHVNSVGKYQKLHRKMLIAALDGLAHEVSHNRIRSPEWAFYKDIIGNLLKSLETEDKR